MKKLYFLLFTFLIASTAYGQELLLNGNFESWDDANTPTSWTKVENVDQEATEINGGTYAAKHTGGTSDLAQTITGISGGTTYTISLWYKVDPGFGDGTDARIWSNWKSGATNLTDNAAELKGPNNAYFDANGNVWTEYSVTLTAPASADSFNFEVRTYGSAVVYWDDFSFFQEAIAVPVLGITSPGDGDFVAGPDVDVALSVQNFNVASGGMGDGYIKYSVDGGASVDKFDTADINLTGLSSVSHTINVELVDNSGNPLANPQTASVTFNVYTEVTLPEFESFDYTVAETLGEQDIWNNNFSGDDIVIESGSLSYSGLNGEGNSISFDGSGTDPSIYFVPVSNGKIYTSFMFKVTAFDGAATDGYFAVLRTDDGSYASRLWISPQTATTYKVGVSNGATLTQTTAATYNVDDVVFVVLNYDIDNDTVNAWVNPTLGGAEPAADLTEASTSSGNTFNQFLIRQDSASETPFIVMDELRGGTTWADVTPATLSNSSFNLDQLSIYPNPTNTGRVTISSSNNDAMNVQVFDVLGKQVKNETLTNNTLNVSDLNTGVYILKITQNNATTTKKLVIR